MRTIETQGEGRDRRDCMKRFRAAWERFEREAQAALINSSILTLVKTTKVTQVVGADSPQQELPGIAPQAPGPT